MIDKWLVGLKVGDPVKRIRANGKGVMFGTVNRVTKTLFVVSAVGPRGAAWKDYEAYCRTDGCRWPRKCRRYSGQRIEKP